MPLTSTVETLTILPPYDGMMADAALGTRPDSAMTPSRTGRFPRTARLLRHADFERVYKQGRRHFSANLTVFYWPRPNDCPDTETQGKKRVGASAPQCLRVGFTVGRALGGAVQRNRMKRRLREAVRMSLSGVGVAADVVINPKKSLLTADFAAVATEVSRAFAIVEQKLSGKPAPGTETDTVAGNRKPRTGSRP
ncbi:MAG: ribonuclease P protein component [Candidatus Sulfotelmatobacter sp.]